MPYINVATIRVASYEYRAGRPYSALFGISMIVAIDLLVVAAFLARGTL